MVTSCCIRNCRNSAKDKYRFFRFPKKRPEKIKIWAEKCGFTYDEIMAHPYWSICEVNLIISIRILELLFGTINTLFLF